MPGGVNKHLTIEERDYLLADIDRTIAWSQEAVEIVKRLYADNKDRYNAFGSFRVVVREPRARPTARLTSTTAGCVRGTSATTSIFDHVDYANYWDVIFEETRTWSYMKFPYLRALGPEAGWYRVGPLARVNNCDAIPTPLAEAERIAFKNFDGGSATQANLAYHWARMIEMLHAAEGLRELLHDPALLDGELVVRGTPALRGVGVIEAPRGTLIHHYRVNEDDQIVRANLIVSTTHNNQAMNEAVRRVALQYLDGARGDRGAAQSHRGRDPRVRSVPVVRDPRARADAPRSRDHGFRRRPTRRARARRGRHDPPSRSAMSRILVLAWGNPSRGDDGLGPALAERATALAASGMP